MTAVATTPPGVLLVLNDVIDSCEDEFNRWYQQQHVPERLAVPGFRTARRYRVVDGAPAYMAVYECDSIEVLASPAYLERLAHPTQWTKQIMPGFRNMLRSACRETWSVGAGMGGSAIVVQCSPVPGREDAARSYVTAALAPEMMQSGSLVRMALWEADAAFTGGPSPEMALRGGADKSADWIVFLDSHDPARTEQALHARLSANTAAATGLRVDSHTRYQLICALAA